MTVRPSFLANDPQTITAQLLAEWERIANKPLYPAQIERLLIDLAAYRETLTRFDIQDSAEQNLLGFARGNALDALAELLGATRLPPEPARVMLRFTLEKALPIDRVWPKAYIVRSGEGQRFELASDLRLFAGQVTGDVLAIAQVGGTAANQLEPNSIIYPDLPDDQFTVTNLSSPMDGREAESDEAFRIRLRLAAARAAAGSFEAYQYQALSLSVRIVAAKVTSPSPGRVRVALLCDTGTPDDALITHAVLALNDPRTRPFTDEIQVWAAQPKVLTLAVSLIVRRGNPLVADAVRARLDAFALARRKRLGQDLRAEQIVAQVLTVGGVIGLSELPPIWNQSLEAHEFLDVRRINVTIAEVRDE